MTYLYQDGTDYVFMDQSTYEQINVPAETVGDARNFMVENQDVIVSQHDGTVLFVELPATVVLTITHTEPGLQGDRSSAGTKPATLETGYEIQVPLFMEEGTRVKVDTPRRLVLGSRDRVMSKQHRFTSRTKARKRAADVVYEADQRGMGSNPDVLRDLLRERRVITAAQTPLPEFSIQIIAGVADNLRRIDSLISAHARVPGLDRIAAVDLAVMRVAVWEMLENARCRRSSSSTRPFSIVRSISTDTSPRS